MTSISSRTSTIGVLAALAAVSAGFWMLSRSAQPALDARTRDRLVRYKRPSAEPSAADIHVAAR